MCPCSCAPRRRALFFHAARRGVLRVQRALQILHLTPGPRRRASGPPGDITFACAASARNEGTIGAARAPSTSKTTTEQVGTRAPLHHRVNAHTKIAGHRVFIGHSIHTAIKQPTPCPVSVGQKFSHFTYVMYKALEKKGLAVGEARKAHNNNNKPPRTGLTVYIRTGPETSN